MGIGDVVGDMVRDLSGAWTATKAELMFQGAGAVLTEYLSVEQLRGLAREEKSLHEVVPDLFPEVDLEKAPSAEEEPTVAYLKACSDDYLLRLLAEVAPDHVAVLHEHPGFRQKLIRDLRDLF